MPILRYRLTRGANATVVRSAAMTLPLNLFLGDDSQVRGTLSTWLSTIDAVAKWADTAYGITYQGFARFLTIGLAPEGMDA